MTAAARPVTLEFSLDRPVTHFLRFSGNVSLQFGMQGRRSGRKEATRLRVALQVCRENSCAYCGAFGSSKRSLRHQVRRA